MSGIAGFISTPIESSLVESLWLLYCPYGYASLFHFILPERSLTEHLLEMAQNSPYAPRD
jgi:hypothetical protein